MFKKRLFPKLFACAVAVALVAALALAAYGSGTSAGTTSDPLVTFSYVDKTFRAELLQHLQQNLGASQAEHAQSVNTMLDRMGNQGYGYQPPQSAQTGYVSITVPAGETLTLYAGQQLLVLSGSGKVSANMMVDVTAGASLAAGNALSENHFYNCPAECAVTADGELQLLVK